VGRCSICVRGLLIHAGGAGGRRRGTAPLRASRRESIIVAMNINLLAVKFAPSLSNNKYGLIIAPPLHPHPTRLDPNNISKHAYETLEQLWQVIQACGIVSVPNYAALESELAQASTPLLVARMSEEAAQHMGFK